MRKKGIHICLSGAGIAHLIWLFPVACIFLKITELCSSLWLLYMPHFLCPSFVTRHLGRFHNFMLWMGLCRHWCAASLGGADLKPSYLSGEAGAWQRLSVKVCKDPPHWSPKWLDLAFLPGAHKVSLLFSPLPASIVTHFLNDCCSD